jgi:ferrous iron transport protein B
LALGVRLQGLVLFVLYLAGVLASLAVAWVIKRASRGGRASPLMLELPWYHVPRARNIGLLLVQRAKIFLRRVGVVILVLTVLLWVLANFPAPPAGAAGAPIEYSFAGMLGRALAVVLGPVGFNWQIAVALVPGIAAREVIVGALGTVYSLSATGTSAAQALQPVLAHEWGAATGFSLLAWFVFAPQCVSTIATVKRETGRMLWPVLMTGYMFALAWGAAWVTYRVALAWT